MQLVLLLTDELKQSKPDSIKITENYGEVCVRFDGYAYPSLIGDHCILEGSKEDMVKWLAPFKGVARGIGPVMLQEFEIVHVSDESIRQYEEPTPKQPKEEFRALEL
jgi:hypothetical protein